MFGNEELTQKPQLDSTSQPPGAGVLATITERLPDLRQSERKVATVILNDPTAALDMSISRLAAAAGVSDPTVMRFCSAVGYSGYQVFRLSLAQSLAFGVPATHSAIGREDTSEAIVKKVFAYALSSLDHSRRMLDVNAVVDAIDLIADAGELVFVGHGASHIVAQDAAQKFPLFGIPCSAPADSHQQHMMASMISESSVVVLISNTGSTASVLELARITKERGARVIGITGSRGLLSDLSDVALIVETLENTDLFTPTISRIAALVVIDILSTGVALRRSDSHISRVQDMKASLAELRPGRL